MNILDLRESLALIIAALDAYHQDPDPVSRALCVDIVERHATRALEIVDEAHPILVSPAQPSPP